jgi:hypothetical protein
MFWRKRHQHFEAPAAGEQRMKTYAGPVYDPHPADFPYKHRIEFDPGAVKYAPSLQGLPGMMLAWGYPTDEQLQVTQHVPAITKEGHVPWGMQNLWQPPSPNAETLYSTDQLADIIAAVAGGPPLSGDYEF